MSVAPSLVRSGVPAVIAQQAPVPDRIAKSFSGTLYDYLAKGTPVDEIVTEMRIRAFVSSGDVAHWAIPVLFMRAPDGRLWVTPDPNKQTEPRPANAQNGGVTISDISNSQISIGNVVGGDMIGTSPGGSEA